MKRLVWLLIAVFGTAFAQVSPVISPFAQDEACCCTGEPAGACGMPDCAPAPTACQPSLTLQTPTAQRAVARRTAPARQTKLESYFVKFESRPALPPAVRVSLPGTPAARVPLFKAHCSFLI